MGGIEFLRPSIMERFVHHQVLQDDVQVPIVSQKCELTGDGEHVVEFVACGLSVETLVHHCQ